MFNFFMFISLILLIYMFNKFGIAINITPNSIIFLLITNEIK